MRAGSLVPEAFLDFSSRKRSRASREAAITSRESDKEREKNHWLPWPRISFSCRRQGQDRPSGVDWMIFFQTRKPIWLVRLIVTTEGTLRIFTPHFVSLYRGRKLFVCCTRNNICRGLRHVKARHISRFWHVCCSWKNIRRNFDLGTWWALSWVSLNNKRKLCSPCWVERMCSPFYQPDMEST